MDIAGKLRYFVNKRRREIQRVINPYNTSENIILHAHQSIYFYIPKVACTSLKAYFAWELGITFQHKTQIHDLPFPSLPKDQLLHLYPHYFKFAFVRNPWDRMYSLYKEKIKDDPSINNPWVINGVERGLAGYGKLFYAGMPFTEFLEIISGIPDAKSNEHFRSQYTFITDKKGKLITDFVGKFESLAQDFQHIRSKIQLEQDIPHLNTGRERGGTLYTTYYDKYTIELVRKRFGKDIELFNYQF